MKAWEKVRISGHLIASILIPMVLVVATNIYSTAEKEKDLNARYIELAIGILRDEPKSGSEKIRSWAIDVINLYSEVKLSEKTRKQLIETRILEVPESIVEFQKKLGLAPDGIVGPATIAKLNREVKELLSKNEKVSAIKHVRAVLNTGLKESKEYVEAIEAGQEPKNPSQFRH